MYPVDKETMLQSLFGAMNGRRPVIYYLLTPKINPVLMDLYVFRQVYKVCSDSFETYDQHYGRGLVKDTVKEGMS